MAKRGDIGVWLGWVALFFAWGFVMHGAGLLLHEVGGHGVVEVLLGRGIQRINLTYFGHGYVVPIPCPWTWTGRVILDWAGLVVTITAGAMALAWQRRPGLAPLTRLLAALLATGFLLGQLAYATSGGYYEVYDPELTAVTLESHGLHILAWLPPLVLLTAAAVVGARAIVGSFRASFGSRTRAHTLVQMAGTLGPAGLLYLVAYRVEAALRSDMVPGVAAAAEERARIVQAAPGVPVHRFPIEWVLVGITVAAFVAALARPVRSGESGEGAGTRPTPGRYAVGVGVAAGVCLAAITLIKRVWG